MLVVSKKRATLCESLQGVWVETHNEVLLDVPKSPRLATDTPPHYISNFPNSLKAALSQCRAAAGASPLQRGSNESAPTAKCQMLHLGSRNHGHSSEREQAARARLLVSPESHQLDLNTISEL